MYPQRDVFLVTLIWTVSRHLLLLVALFVAPCVFGQAPPNTFGVYRELWTNLDPSPGNTLDALTNTTWNPNWPDNPDPSYTTVYDTFEADSNIGVNYYGQRMRAFVVPPVDGAYTFWIASDDSSDLFLSTDEDPVNKQLIAGVATWTASREWSKEANQQSTSIPLRAGR